MGKNPANDNGMDWLSRTIAIILFMLLPGLAGSFADRKLDTNFLTPIGTIMGMVFAVGMLLLLAKKLTPPARGKPIPFEDEKGNDPWDDEPSSREDSTH